MRREHAASPLRRLSFLPYGYWRGLRAPPRSTFVVPQALDQTDTFQDDGGEVRIVESELVSDITVRLGNTKFYLHKFPLLSKCARFQKLIPTTGDENIDIHIHDIPGGPKALRYEMNETVDKGNLIYKIDVFLSSSIFRSWKDSIIVLGTTKAHLPWSEDLKLVSHCIDSISFKASVDTSRLNGHIPAVRAKGLVGEDLTDLDIDSYKQVISAIKTMGMVPKDAVGEAIKAYTYKKLPSLSKVSMIHGDAKVRAMLVTITCLLPSEKGSQNAQKHNAEVNGHASPSASMITVAKVVDGYLTEVAKDPNTPVLKFINLAEAISGNSRPFHDGLYRAIDMYLKEHPSLSKKRQEEALLPHGLQEVVP
ncbi:hypothetical protein ZWY2020_051276 [Hordeum vulgare]|nr:hypothetical protein ZWY2020_051276 [Hordeum vulgare]